jgi:uncharacterized protein YjbI with pentapeptide repeats
MTGMELTALFQQSVDNGEVRTQIKGLNFSDLTISDQKLSCVDFIDCNFTRVLFDSCDLRGSDFSMSKMYSTTFRQCAIYACEFPDAKGSITFEDCVETPTNGWYLPYVDNF